MANNNAKNITSATITLPDGETLDNLNATLAQAQRKACTYKVNITATGKSLTLHKATRQKLQEAGVHTDLLGANGYVSFNKYPQVYNALMNVLEANPDTFSMVGE